MAEQLDMWEVIWHSPSPRDGFTIRTRRAGRYVAEARPRDGLDYAGEEGTRVIAQALLIEAAPLMLAALRDAFEYLELSLGDCDEGCNCVKHPVQDAIAQAQGLRFFARAPGA